MDTVKETILYFYTQGGTQTQPARAATGTERKRESVHHFFTIIFMLLYKQVALLEFIEEEFSKETGNSKINSYYLYAGINENLCKP